MDEKNYTRKIYMVLLFISLILMGFICKTLSSVLLPVITAIFFSFALLPVIQFLKNKCKIPWGISTIILVVLIFIILFLTGTLLVSSLSTIIVEYPKYENKFMSIYKTIAPHLRLEVDEGLSFIENMWKYFKVRDLVQQAALELSTGAVSLAKTIFTILLLMVFLLLEIRYTNKKADTAFQGETKVKVQKIASNTINEIKQFISIKFIVSLATGILVYFVTFIFGMDFPIVWAFIAFIMNFIPIFGSIISCVATTLFAMLEFYPNSIGKIIAIFILMVVINFTIGNILEPRIEGKHLGLSPFIILVSLSVWGYIWGFAGMIFAVPIMVIIKICCENIDYLNPIAVMLGNDNSIES